jgi:hypothetical protein
MDSSNQDRSVTGNADTSEILKRLEAYGALVSECDRYALLGRNAEQNRHTVRPHIYARVKGEYEVRRQTLDQEKEEQQGFLQTELETILERRRALNERCRNESDRLEELDFRVRVGEFSDEEVQETRRDLKEELLEITKALAEAQEVVTRFEQVGLLARASAPAEDAEDTDDEGTDEPTADQDDFLVLEEDPSPSEEASPVVNCPPELQAGSSEAEPGQARSARSPHTPISLHDNVFGYLVALDGSRQGERFPLISSEMTVGSSPNLDIRLADSGIARYHAKIVYRNGRHFIETLERQGSCLVNGVKTNRAELRDGDILSLGRVKMQVEYALEAHA